MKKTAITIIIGFLGTMVALFGAIGAMYLSSIPSAKAENLNTSNKENSPTFNDSREEEITTDNNSQDEEIIPETNSPTSEATNTKPNYTGEKTITLYLFHGSTCPYCLQAKEFLKTIIDDYDYLEIKTLEVWHNKDNSSLMQKVAEKVNVKASGVPFMLIGDTFHKTGYSENSNEKIISAIKESYSNPNYHDIVADTINENKDLNIVIEDLN